MSNLYYYNNLTNLSPEELFLWVAIDQTLEQLGGEDIAAAAAILSGQPILPTRAKFGGVTKGTSIASVTSRNLIRYKMPFALPKRKWGQKENGVRSCKITFIIHLTSI